MSFGRLGALGLGFSRMGGGGKTTPSTFFLLKVDGTSVILLANGTDKLLITGAAPAVGGSGSPMGLLLSLTYP